MNIGLFRILCLTLLVGCGASESTSRPTEAPAAAACVFTGEWTASKHSAADQAPLFTKVTIAPRGKDHALCAEHDGVVNARITPAVKANEFSIVLQRDIAIAQDKTTQTGPLHPVYGKPAPSPDTEGCNIELPPTTSESGNYALSAPTDYMCKAEGPECAALTCSFIRHGQPAGTFTLARSAAKK